MSNRSRIRLVKWNAAGGRSTRWLSAATAFCCLVALDLAWLPGTLSAAEPGLHRLQSVPITQVVVEDPF